MAVFLYRNISHYFYQFVLISSLTVDNSDTVDYTGDDDNGVEIMIGGHLERDKINRNRNVRRGTMDDNDYDMIIGGNLEQKDGV